MKECSLLNTPLLESPSHEPTSCEILATEAQTFVSNSYDNIPDIYSAISMRQNNLVGSLLNPKIMVRIRGDSTAVDL